MSFHRNAKLGLGGRCALVDAIEGGLSIRAAADCFNVSPATAHRWWRRWREADEESRRTLAAHGRLLLRALPAPGPPLTGDRSHRLCGWMKPGTRVGYDYAQAIVDDPSRLAYVELHRDERAQTVTGFLERALAFFAAHGITCKRLMTDNDFSYVKNRSLRELLAARGNRHLTTEPDRPRTNGKVERFHQTTAREWAYGLSYGSHRQRNELAPFPLTPRI